MDIVHLKRKERVRRDDSGAATSLNHRVALSFELVNSIFIPEMGITRIGGPSQTTFSILR